MGKGALSTVWSHNPPWTSLSVYACIILKRNDKANALVTINDKENALMLLFSTAHLCGSTESLSHTRAGSCRACLAPSAPWSPPQIQRELLLQPWNGVGTPHTALVTPAAPQPDLPVLLGMKSKQNCTELRGLHSQH